MLPLDFILNQNIRNIRSYRPYGSPDSVPNLSIDVILGLVVTDQRDPFWKIPSRDLKINHSKSSKFDAIDCLQVLTRNNNLIEKSYINLTDIELSPVYKCLFV